MSERCLMPQGHPTHCGCEQVDNHLDRQLDIERINNRALQSRLDAAEREKSALRHALEVKEEFYQDALHSHIVLNAKVAERDAVLRQSAETMRESASIIDASQYRICGAAATISSLRHRAQQISALLSSAEPVKEESRKWPKDRDVGRYGDMSQSAHIRVGLDGDSDAYVSVYDEEGGASVEFCTQYSGGGKSPKTREALIALMLAIEEDNAAHPDFDWWKRWAPAEPAKGGDGEVDRG